MRVFSDAELQYLGRQGLGRLATVGKDGYPRVVPVAFRYNPRLARSTSAGIDSPGARSSARA